MSSWGTPALVLVFALAVVATWVASEATDGGMLLLGLAGSLPDLAITASAALGGHLSLAVGNLLAIPG